MIKKIGTRILTAFVSSILLAVLLNVLTKELGDISGLVFLYSLPAFLVVGIPVSFFIDRVIPENRWGTRVSAYVVSGLIVSLVSQVVIGINLEHGWLILLLFSGSSCLYMIVLHILTFIIGEQNVKAADG